MTGNEAAARGAALARVQFTALYPITPQTTIIEELARLGAARELTARIMHVESEHSAMAACIGAAYAGARTFTATSSQGLALMHELLHWAGGARLPIVMADVNRAMAPGWSIWTDQSDSLSQRDTGWMQFYCSTNQEVLDTTVMAFKLAERVMVPCMIVLDAFVLSHTAEAVEVPPRPLVDGFLPPYDAPFKLDLDDPCSFGALLRPAHYQIVRKKLQGAMEEALGVTREIEAEWASLTGRRYSAVETAYMEDAELALVATGTVAGTARAVVDQLRRRNRKVGLIRIRQFRPFPAKEVREAMANVPTVAVFDRNISYGHHGIFAQEIKSALYNAPHRPILRGYVGGLGGKDVTPETIERMIEDAAASSKQGEDLKWVD